MTATATGPLFHLVMANSATAVPHLEDMTTGAILCGKRLFAGGRYAVVGPEATPTTCPACVTAAAAR